MIAFIFPGQGAQYSGMGKSIYDEYSLAKDMFNQANDILGFSITDVMFNGSEDDLKQTNVTQPAIYLHSVIASACLMQDAVPDVVAGHSLGEFSALAINKSLSFEDGLRLVSLRAKAMQKACELAPSTMAAVLGAEDKLVSEVCEGIDDVVVPANFNTVGQIVISGSISGIDEAMKRLKDAGVRRVIKLKVSGAFHSPLMQPARDELKQAIDEVKFNTPICPVYQNFDALPTISPEVIKEKLVAQLTSPVRWTDTVRNMLTDGITEFTEIGPGEVLKGLIKKIDRKVPVNNIK